MKFFAIFPVLCTFIALILSLLCILAGSKQGFMEDYAIVTFNTSRIGVDVFNTSSTSNQPNSSGILGGLIGDAENEIHKLESDVEKALMDVTASFAKTIGLHDFYSIYVLDFCEGFYNPSGTSSKNVTYCSNSKSFFSFNPEKTLRRELKSNHLNVTLSDLHWPSAITYAVDTLAVAFNAMFLLYCLGTVLVGLSFFTSLFAIFKWKPRLALINTILACVAFFALLIAAGVVNHASVKIANVVNHYGRDIDVNAIKGSKLISISWTAVILMAVVSLAWTVDYVHAKSKEKSLKWWPFRRNKEDTYPEEMKMYSNGEP